MKIFTRIYNNIQTKPAFVVGLIAMLLVPTAVIKAEFPSNINPYPANFYAMCFDGIDNNGDGKIDMKDRNCPKCFDGIDNDGNSLIDGKDPACPNYTGSNNPPQKNAFGKVLGAFTSDTPPNNYGGYIDTGGNIPAGGFIESGGALGTCTRVIVFPQKHFTTNNSYYYTYTYYCYAGIDLGNDQLFQDEINSPAYRGRFISSGGMVTSNKTLVTGGAITSGGNIASGGTINAGGFIPTGN